MPQGVFVGVPFGPALLQFGVITGALLKFGKLVSWREISPTYPMVIDIVLVIACSKLRLNCSVYGVLRLFAMPFRLGVPPKLVNKPLAMRLLNPVAREMPSVKQPLL